MTGEEVISAVTRVLKDAETSDPWVEDWVRDLPRVLREVAWIAWTKGSSEVEALAGALWALGSDASLTEALGHQPILYLVEQDLGQELPLEDRPESWVTHLLHLAWLDIREPRRSRFEEAVGEILEEYRRRLLASLRGE
jgi:hypothetical protein